MASAPPKQLTPPYHCRRMMSALRRSQYEKFLRSIGPSFSLGAITRVVADLQYGFEKWLRGPDSRELWKARILRHVLMASAPAMSGGCVLTVEMEQRAVERAAYLQQHTAPPFPRSGVQADTVNSFPNFSPFPSPSPINRFLRRVTNELVLKLKLLLLLLKDLLLYCRHRLKSFKLIP
jgi:hypothetical protein